jgi:hypothetical protein
MFGGFEAKEIKTQITHCPGITTKFSIIAIQIHQPTRCNNFSSLLLDVYVQLNMFQAFSRPSSGAQQMQ